MGTRRRTPHLIGRERPLRDLLDALEETGPSEGALVLVSGEAGIGKTRLLDEFAARAEEVVVARGGCVEGVAYAPWTDALWWLLEAIDPAALDELPPRLRAQLAPLVPQWSDTSAEGENEDGGQHALFEAVVELLRYVSARTKLVLVVDDVHWIDPASRGLLRYVAGNLRRIGILLVVAYRPEDSASERELLAQLGRLGRLRIALEGLPEDAAAEIGRYLLGDDASPEDVERVVGDADGNPLFVEELVAALDEGGVPPTVRDLMLVRFESLDDDARHLVRTAALIGPRAPSPLLTGASGFDETRGRAAGRQAVDTGVLLTDPDGRGYVFRHALLRQAILDELVPDERVERHRAIAVALTEHPERAPGTDHVAELARHWALAGDTAAALHWAVAAAQHAESRYAYEAAADAYDRALSLWGSVPEPEALAGIDHAALLLAAADTSGLAGRVEHAADLATSAVEEASALDPTRGVDTAARAYPMLWVADRAGELFELASTRLEPVLGDVDGATRARFLVSTVEHTLELGSPEEMRDATSRMMAAVGELDDAALRARAHHASAGYYERSGQFDLVEGEYESAARIARDARAHSAVALVLYNHAAFYTSVPDFRRCATILDDVDRVVEQYDIRKFWMPARCLRAQAAACEGDLATAATILSSIDNVFLEGYEASFRAWAHALTSLYSGEFDTVLSVLDPINVGVMTSAASEMGINHTTQRADALAWRGDLDAARHAADKGFAGLERRSDAHCHGWLAMVAMRIEADAAGAATASRHLDAIEQAQLRGETILDGWNAVVAQLHSVHPLAIAHSRACEAEMARLRGEGVADAAIAAADEFDAISMPYYATYFRWRAAEAAFAANDRRTGIPLLEQARGVARLHGFAGLDAAITSLARSHQLRIGPGKTTVDGDVPLSVRELEVLRLIVDGKSNPEIAEILCISAHTARAHVSNILRKLDTPTRVEAASAAVRGGLV